MEIPESYTENIESKQKMKIIVVLGGVMKYREGMSPQFPLVNATDKDGMKVEISGGDSRMIVAEKLIDKLNLEGVHSHIFTTGGNQLVDTGNGEIKSFSRAEELREKYVADGSFDPNEITALPSGKSTLGNAEAILDWISKHTDEVGLLEEVEIVTNSYHMPRAWLLFAASFYKNKTGKDIEFSPEDIDIINNLSDKETKDSLYIDKSRLEAIKALIHNRIDGIIPNIKPIIVEEELLKGSEAEVKYAQLILSNSHVNETRALEMQGIKDFMRGIYKVK